MHKRRKWGRIDISALGISSREEQERRDGSRIEREREFEGRTKERELYRRRRRAQKGSKMVGEDIREGKRCRGGERKRGAHG